jgi:hypothetical protein
MDRTASGVGPELKAELRRSGTIRRQAGVQLDYMAADLKTEELTG